MKDSLKRAFALKPLAKLVAHAVTPCSAPAQASQPDSFAIRVAAHAAALVALMDATVAVHQAVGVKTAAAMEEYGMSLHYLKQLANVGAKAVPVNPYWGERKASARAPDAKPGQSLHHRILSRTK